jgi:type II secretory pathway predicted ATPase ExeA
MEPMHSKKQLTLYGLKWNPFLPDLPPEGLIETEQAQRFAWKIENLVMDGGFALITGEPGTGKSVILRILHERLRNLRDVKVASFTRPQSGLGDFYRELGAIFDVDLRASNRYGGYRALREKWKLHIESTLLRPVLLIDESQEMPAATLSELRLLSSMNFDSQNILTIVLCGDRRLSEKFRLPDLQPLGSRIRARLVTEPAARPELSTFLKESIARAGNSNLMSQDLIMTLVDHAAGNFRVLTTMAAELLMEAIAREKSQLDEQLFFDVFQPQKSRAKGQNSKGKQAK